MKPPIGLVSPISPQHESPLTPSPAPESQGEASRFTQIHRLDRVDSTNAEALRAVAEGTAVDGQVWIAREQSAGRGRRGRAWWSAPGEGLYLSAVWIPTRPLQAPWITMTAGWAVWGALRELGAQGLGLKWPNDVMHVQGKLAGILVESRTQGSSKARFVVGIGINRSQRSFPSELVEQQAVTSLALLGIEVSAEGLEATLLRSLDQACGLAEADPQAVCDAYWEASPWAHERLALEGPTGSEWGHAVALDAQRGLRWRPETGPERWERLEFIRSLVPATTP